ncbi:hypothetical protein Pmani_017393 [Petrolisthes manimaculis]|uniref:Uncharacterized protein n=1 Tax=Petrolisthes manimaculis TaxID=1843537 RepID=A0AAE1PME1_9EUCA|nr:hypothetical protein Pmani_017393 [Petrolisthes manimaculis]
MNLKLQDRMLAGMKLREIEQQEVQGRTHKLYGGGSGVDVTQAPTGPPGGTNLALLFLTVIFLGQLLLGL